jgi:hypothetical protein
MVTFIKDNDTIVCETPPLGQEGDINGVYYARDGKTIKVRPCPQPSHLCVLCVCLCVCASYTCASSADGLALTLRA